MHAVSVLLDLRGYARNVEANRFEEAHGQRSEEPKFVRVVVHHGAREGHGLALKPCVRGQDELDNPRDARLDIVARARGKRKRDTPVNGGPNGGVFPPSP